MLNRFLFLLTVGIALTFMGLLVFAPLLVGEGMQEQPAWLLLFALDAAIRRTTLACGGGLVVNALLFFRAPDPLPTLRIQPKPQRFENTIGA